MFQNTINIFSTVLSCRKNCDPVLKLYLLPAFSLNLGFCCQLLCEAWILIDAVNLKLFNHIFKVLFAYIFWIIVCNSHCCFNWVEISIAPPQKCFLRALPFVCQKEKLWSHTYRPFKLNCELAMTTKWIAKSVSSTTLLDSSNTAMYNNNVLKAEDFVDQYKSFTTQRWLDSNISERLLILKS